MILLILRECVCLIYSSTVTRTFLALIFYALSELENYKIIYLKIDGIYIEIRMFLQE